MIIYRTFIILHSFITVNTNLAEDALKVLSEILSSEVYWDIGMSLELKKEIGRIILIGTSIELFPC